MPFYHHLQPQRGCCIPSKAWILLAVLAIILLANHATHSFDGAIKALLAKFLNKIGLKKKLARLIF